jgi:hypothetical protein
MNKWLLFILIAGALGFFLFSRNQALAPTSVPSPTQEVIVPTQRITPPPPSSTGPPNNTPNIIVTNPIPNQKVDRSIVVQGVARTFENNVHIRLSESGGKVLVDTFTTANSPDTGQYGNFEKTIQVGSASGAKLLLEVFQNSAKDGSEVDKVRIPLTR